MVRARPLVLALFVLSHLPAQAAPLPPSDVPEVLRPWVPWVLQYRESETCTWVDSGTHRCLWPARLTLRLDDTGGSFEQTWHTEIAAWVPVPGDLVRRPLDVSVDGRPAPVHFQGATPGVRLEAGTHRLAGRLAWESLPEVVPVPPETGVLELTLRGAPVPFPQREDDGRIWLHRKAAEEATENRLDLLVHRRVVDEIPAEVHTRIELRVSGENREVVLGRALIAGLVPMSLTSPLPARVEPDGRIRVQVRPGTFSIELGARYQGRFEALALADADGPWPQEEIWVYEARPSLRIAEVDGVMAIDPMQTRLPDEWRSLPAYRVLPGETFKIVERRRGDADPAPDQLTLARQMWLDADGGGVTIQDQLNGTLHSGWRLEMPEPTVLGRVAVDGHDQLITRLRPEAAPGVEIRRRQVSVVADSRWPGGAGGLPAVGWDHDFHSVSATLNLPPGWRLLHASGVDEVPSTWLKAWTLLDLFLVLIFSLSIWRLWGWVWGALALVTLVLLFPESDAPKWIWGFVLAGEGLLRVLPAGWFRKVIWSYRLVMLVVLAGISITFMVQEIRQGMYPVLEHPWQQLPSGGYDPSYGGNQFGIPGLLGASADALSGSENFYDQEALAAPEEKSLRQNEVNRSRRMRKAAYSSYQVDPNAVVQTGPGLPRWSWQSVSLGWNGPVSKGQQLGLWLVPPAGNLVLGFVRALLLSILGLLMVGFPGAFWPGFLKRAGARTAAAAGLLFLLMAPTLARAELPSREVLEELRSRLTATPECLPACASVPRLILEATPGELRARMELDAAAQVAVPLPADPKQWMPDEILVDGRPAERLARTSDGRLWLGVSPGKHQLVLTGPLPGREVVQLPLPLPPGHTRVRAEGWTVEGMHADGIADQSLQLTRVRRAESDGGGRLESDALPPFVRVTRTIHLGLTWEMETQIDRVSPLGTAVVLEVPLLDGESPTTEGLRVAEGRVLVNMAPSHSSLSWTSDLAQREVLTLEATTSTSWAEVWQVAASPIWHLDAEGIPPVHQEDQNEVRVWRPWPGEGLRLTVLRPAAVPGRSLTIDQSKLVLTPGQRATDASLRFSLRSSRGGQHVVTLPAGAVLQTVTIDGLGQPIRQEDRKVNLPVHPGAQAIELSWRDDRAITTHWTTPEVDLGAESVNAEVDVNVPRSRWVLFVFGPTAGPAVLFWSLLVVLLIAAEILWRVRLTPLKLHDWILLGVGLTQVELFLSFIVVGWLLFLGWRAKKPDVGYGWFDLRQILLGGWTVAALITLFVAVEHGLLGEPQMQISGNGSSGSFLHWYQDRTGTLLPVSTVISVPLMVYRLAMLGWALWLAVAILRWLKWGWSAFREGGLWKYQPKVVPPVPAQPVAPSAPQP